MSEVSRKLQTVRCLLMFLTCSNLIATTRNKMPVQYNSLKTCQQMSNISETGSGASFSALLNTPAVLL